MAGRASRFLAEQMLAAVCGFFIKASSWRIWDAQTQLIIQQCPKLRGDEIRRLRDEEANTWIAEIAMAAHLSHSHIAVPIRDGPIGSERLEADALQSVDGRDHNRQRWTIQRNEVRAVERMVAGIVFARAPRAELGLESIRQRWRQSHDRPHVQVEIRPYVQPLSDTRRERVVDGRVAERARDADAGQLARPVHIAFDA